MLYEKSPKLLGFQLTRYNGKAGILRCTHTAKEQGITLLQNITKASGKKITLTTHQTSGTIKTILTGSLKSYNLPNNRFKHLKTKKEEKSRP